MRILAISFLFSTTISIIHANQKNCPSSNCGNLSITYPFKLQNSQTENDCSYVDLKCNKAPDHVIATINLPNAGDFYVRNISYGYPYIQLYDPGNCLVRRLMMNDTFSLSSSPVESFIGSYTFYTCPATTDVRDGLYPIDCLSNTTNVTVATQFPPSVNMEGTGCQESETWVLPFPSNGFNHDLYLTWDSTSCPACANTDEGNSWGGFSGWPYFSSTFVVIAVVVTTCSFLITRKIVGRPSTAAEGLPVSGVAVVEPPQPISGGLEESKIESYTKLTVLSQSIVDSGCDAHTCAICLESFEPQELVRSISRCEHCFHAECIVTWLIKTRTCPVCRITLSDT